eukprot:Tbor_TRINITY_DN5454_c0_g2::TRINITY_DN5454_c0_g2_i1::g.25000::m.25000
MDAVLINLLEVHATHLKTLESIRKETAENNTKAALIEMQNRMTIVSSSGSHGIVSSRDAVQGAPFGMTGASANCDNREPHVTYLPKSKMFEIVGSFIPSSKGITCHSPCLGPPQSRQLGSVDIPSLNKHLLTPPSALQPSAACTPVSSDHNAVNGIDVEYLNKIDSTLLLKRHLASIVVGDKSPSSGTPSASQHFNSCTVDDGKFQAVVCSTSTGCSQGQDKINNDQDVCVSVERDAQCPVTPQGCESGPMSMDVVAEKGSIDRRRIEDTYGIGLGVGSLSSSIPLIVTLPTRVHDKESTHMSVVNKPVDSPELFLAANPTVPEYVDPCPTGGPIPPSNTLVTDSPTVEVRQVSVTSSADNGDFEEFFCHIAPKPSYAPKTPATHRPCDDGSGSYAVGMDNSNMSCEGSGNDLDDQGGSSQVLLPGRNGGANHRHTDCHTGIKGRRIKAPPKEKVMKKAASKRARTVQCTPAEYWDIHS